MGLAAFTLGDAVVRVSASMKSFNKALGDAERKAKRSFGNITKLGENMGRAMFRTGLVVSGAFLFAAKGAADFDKAMREVNTLVGLGEDDFQSLSKDVRELSKEMGINAVEAASALYQALSAGIPEENAIDFMRVASKTAIGGVTDLKTAVDGLTTVMNAYKIPISEAERVSDIMFETMKGGKTTILELSERMFNVAPIAKAAGISFEEVSAGMIALTLQGTPTRVATTQLRQAIVAFLKPTKEMSEALEKATGMTGAQTLEIYGLQKSIDLVNGALGNNLASMSKAYGSIEGFQGVVGITGENTKAFSEALDTVSNSAGSTTKAFEEMEKSASQKFNKLLAQLQDLRIEIGNEVIPALIDIVEALRPMIVGMGAWISNNKELIPHLVKLGGIILVGGPLLMGISKFATLAAKLGLLLGAGTAVGGALGLTTIVIGLAAAFDMWKNRNAGYTNFIQKLIDKVDILRKALDATFDRIYDIIEIMSLPGKYWIDLLAKVGGRTQELAGDSPEMLGSGSSRTTNYNYGPSNVSVNLAGVSNPEQFARELASIMRRRKL